jgi:hypothetical protein
MERNFPEGNVQREGEIMKVPCCFLLIVSLVIATGCQSNSKSASNGAHAQRISQVRITSDSAAGRSVVVTNPALPNVHYRVEVLPNSRLSPTSREGDRPRAIYSSNIIAVYVETNGVNTASTNAMPALPEERGR